jgi:hypothetical protein
MPAYEIVVHCHDCGGEHPILIKIHLDEGPERKQSVAELYGDQAAPPQVAAIRGHKGLCLKSGRSFKLESDADIFLVPSASLRGGSLA